jgi:hypothetical protein
MSGPIITVHADGQYRDLKGRFAKADRQLLEDRRESVRELGRRWVELAREEAPKRTGRFASRIAYRTFVEDDTIGFRGYVPRPLGRWIIQGTPPHLIRAQNGRFLRFFWQAGPRGPGLYFFRKVNHPGTKPNPFTDRANERFRPEADRAMRRIATRYVMIAEGKQ